MVQSLRELPRMGGVEDGEAVHDLRMGHRGSPGDAPAPVVPGYQRGLGPAFADQADNVGGQLIEVVSMDAVTLYTRSIDGIHAVALDRIGGAQHDPDTQNAGIELLKISVQGTQEAAGRAFSSRMVELALSSYPCLYALGPPQAGSAFGVYWPALLKQRLLEHAVHHHDGTTEIIMPSDQHGTGTEVTPHAEPWAALSVPVPWTDELVNASLGEIVHARSGDKGGDANIGVWVRDRERGTGSGRPSRSTNCGASFPRRAS